jgi:hypothetical protein
MGSPGSRPAHILQLSILDAETYLRTQTARPAWILGTLHLPVKDRRARLRIRTFARIFPRRAIPGILNSQAANTSQ